MKLRDGSAELYVSARKSLESRYGEWLPRFAERWADLMEQASEDQPLADVWTSAYYKADILAFGLNGNNLPTIAWFLANTWERGEEFWQLYEGHWGGKIDDSTPKVISPFEIGFDLG